MATLKDDLLGSTFKILGGILIGALVFGALGFLGALVLTGLPAIAAGFSVGAWGTAAGASAMAAGGLGAAGATAAAATLPAAATATGAGLMGGLTGVWAALTASAASAELVAGATAIGATAAAAGAAALGIGGILPGVKSLWEKAGNTATSISRTEPNGNEVALTPELLAAMMQSQSPQQERPVFDREGLSNDHARRVQHREVQEQGAPAR